MANSTGAQGGSHDQHVKAGQQSHKTTSGSSSEKHATSQSSGHASGKSAQGGGAHDQQAKAGQQSHKHS